MTTTVDPRFPNSIPAGLVVDETQLQPRSPGVMSPLSLDRWGQLLITGNVVATVTIPGIVSVTYADNLTLTTGASNASVPLLFDGTNYDRQRPNIDAVLLASAARTANTTSSDQVNYNGRGVHVAVNVTVATASTLTVTIQGNDPISGAYYDILAGTAIAATGLTILKVYPGIGAIAGGSASDILPRTWRVNCVKGDGSSWTYSVHSSVII